MKTSIFTPNASRAAALLLAASGWMWVGCAHAELVIQDELPAPVPVAVTHATIENVGVPMTASVVQKDIVNLDFTQALKQVVPAGWKGFADASSGVTKVGKVSVKAAKRPWTQVLEEMLSQNGLQAVVNWDRKEITFRARA